MNITGTPLYSKEVGAMRNASDYRDTLNRLIFIYPFGVDQSLINIPFNTFIKGDLDTVSDALRSFFSVSILKEIFTSNALNLVTLASTYERYKKKENKSNILINSLLRGDSSGAYPYGIPGDDTYELPDVDSVTLQSKIDQKFSKIKDSLKTDQRLRRLLPFMEVITLQNLLDVPVITGTFPFQLDTSALFTLLAGAIAMRTKLESWSEVKRVIAKLKGMNDNTVYQIFDVLSNVETASGVPSIISKSDLPGGLPNQFEEIKNKIAQTDNPNVKKELTLQLGRMKSDYATTYVSNLKDTKMKELERNFMFMLDPERLLVKFGLGNAVSQAAYAAKKVSPQTDMLFDRTRQQFTEFLGGADSLFSSTYMLFSPIVATDPNWGETYLSMKDKLVNFVYDNFDNFMRNLRNEFDTSITRDIESSSISISSMNKSCDSAKEDFVSALNLFNRTLSGNQIFPTFSYNDVKKFSDAVDSIVGKFRQIKKNTEDSLTQFFGRDNMKRISESFDNLISNTFDVFFTKFKITGDPSTQLQARLFAIDYDADGDPDKILSRRKMLHQTLLLSISEATKLILQTVFLMIFKLNLCDFIEVADVEFSVAKNDVLDLPNYCLVLPLEIIQALYVLYTKRQWKEAVVRSGSGGFNPLNSSYIKGVVKVIRIQLGIPNLIVYDRKKNEVYYSFRYLGNITEKLKMQSVETFVKHYLQNNASGVSQVYY